MEKDVRCYCNDTGNCPYCNEDFFKDTHNLIVYPTFDGPDKPITAFNDFDLTIEFTHIPEDKYYLSVIYKNDLNNTKREGYIYNLYLQEEGVPMGIVFTWSDHRCFDWRRRINYLLRNHFN